MSLLFLDITQHILVFVYRFWDRLDKTASIKNQLTLCIKSHKNGDVIYIVAEG
jgi:hypothetical protein